MKTQWEGPSAKLNETNRADLGSSRVELTVHYGAMPAAQILELQSWDSGRRLRFTPQTE